MARVRQPFGRLPLRRSTRPTRVASSLDATSTFSDPPPLTGSPPGHVSRAERATRSRSRPTPCRSQALNERSRWFGTLKQRLLASVVERLSAAGAVLGREHLAICV